jgi:hypothetical protein
MPRGCRFIILAIAGLILIGAAKPPKEAAKSEQGKEQRKISNTLEDIAATLKDAQKPDQATKPCDPKKPNRNSDLCAQWKAADAATDAAQAAWWQFWLGAVGLILGAVTMMAAIAAAFFAKRAADETKRTADTAVDALNHDRDSTKAEIQPYVFAERIELTRSQTDPHRASITAIFKNYGATPALYVESMIGWEILDYPLTKKPVHFGISAETVSEIAPQQEMQVPFPVPESRIGAHVLVGPQKGKALVIHVSCRYENRLDLKSASWSGFYIYDGPGKGFRRLAMFDDERLGGFAAT